jgi:YD repeat-containing protein
MVYQIKVNGKLDKSWSVWLGGAMIISEFEEDGSAITTLTVDTTDQPALFDILDRIRDMNLLPISAPLLILLRDANGNLLSDGTNTYSYDSANRLISVTNAITASTYAYHGLGDRLQETVNGQATTFVMDLAAGFTQALSDGTNT